MAKRRANGEGNIRKRGDGRWEGRYTAGHDPDTEKVIYKNVLAKTQKGCKEKLKRAGLPQIWFHDMRHTFATVALQNGVDIKTVSGMLSHYSAGFTLDAYAHMTTQAQRQAADTMANILSGAVGN